MVGHDERSADGGAGSSLSPYKHHKEAISPRKFKEFWNEQIELEQKRVQKLIQLHMK